MRDQERRKGGGGGEEARETGGEQEAEKSKCTQNEKMIRFMRSEATKFVAVLKNPSLLHLMGTHHGL